MANVSKNQQLKELGLNKSQVGRQLAINWKTVDFYWDMTPEEFAERQSKAKNRRKILEPYTDQILQWIMKFPDISSAQIHDWLKEYHGDNYYGKDRTVRRYVVICAEHLIFQSRINIGNTRP